MYVMKALVMIRTCFSGPLFFINVVSTNLTISLTNPFLSYCSHLHNIYVAKCIILFCITLSKALKLILQIS